MPARNAMPIEPPIGAHNTSRNGFRMTGRPGLTLASRYTLAAPALRTPSLCSMR